MKILVPLDGSVFSEAILSRVVSVAPTLDAQIELLTIAPCQRARQTPATYGPRDTIPAAVSSGTRLNIPLLADIVPPPAESREQAVERVEAETLDYLRARARKLGFEATARVIVSDDPAAAIIDHARDEQVDLIAMTTHGRGGINHLLSGSVTERVIRSGVAPVLTLRPRD